MREKIRLSFKNEKTHFQVAVKKLKAADSHSAILISSGLFESVIAQTAEIRHVHITHQAGKTENEISVRTACQIFFKFGCTYNVSALYERGKQISAVAIAMSAVVSGMRD